jgi:hypothetical protein
MAAHVRDDRITAAVAWLGAFAIAAFALVLVNFNSQDPDSEAYARISAGLASRPMSQWIAPDWVNWAGTLEPFREHPVGVFLLPALLGKLGVPPVPAAFVIGVGLSILVLVLLRQVAALIVGPQGSKVVPWVALILPVAFINRIRATQEYPVLVLVLLAVYATQKSRTSAAWIVVTILATSGTALVKGVFVVFVPIVCGLWLLCVREGGSGDRRAWLGVALSMAAVVAATMAYESLYHRTTGDSFLDYYLPYRFGQIAAVDRSAAALIASKIGNVGWYSARVLWFGFPGTLALLAALATRKRSASSAAPRRREVQGLYFAIGVAAAYVAVMSLGSTRAERFILPAYFSLGVAGALVATRRWEGPARVADRLAGLKPYVLALAWLLLLLAALPFELYVPYVKFR